MGVLCQNFVVKDYERLILWVAVLLGMALTTVCIGWNFLTWAPRSIWDDASEGWCWLGMISNTAYGSSWYCVRCEEQACIDYWSAEPHLAVASTDVCAGLGWLLLQDAS